MGNNDNNINWGMLTAIAALMGAVITVAKFLHDRDEQKLRKQLLEHQIKEKINGQK